MPKPNDPQQKTDDPQQKKPDDSQQKPANPAPADPAPDPFEGINARLASMEQAQADMMQAISALANQGAVNASVQADNGNVPDGDDYPEIDLDSINRLIGE